MKTKPPNKQQFPNLLPLVAVAAASVLYIVFAAIWLIVSGAVTIVTAIATALVFFVYLTAITLFIVYMLRRSDKKAEDADKEVAKDNADYQRAKFHRQAWIQSLRREDRMIHDRIFRLGAVIGVGLVLYALVMKVAFGLSPEETYFVAWWIVGLIWFFQIVLFPRWLTYTSFLTLAALRFGIQTFGPQILVYLPNFLMLPVFYLLMMFFMYGSVMLPNLWQIKYYKPGTGNWEVPEGTTRGQFGARAMIDTQIDRFVRYAEGKSDRKPARGMVAEGPPGTGKTLYAKEIATKLHLPFVMADGSAFNAPFMGFGQLIPLIMRAQTEGMAREYGGAVVFIDEGEIVFGARSGMQQNQFSREVDFWDVVSNSGDLVIDAPHIRTRRWNEMQMAAAQKAPSVPDRHGIFMMPGSGGGASSAIFPFLTWMSGTGSVPFLEKFIRNILNQLLGASFIIPVTFFGLVLRLPPGKPKESNVFFITATNRFWMFDPAMIRPGRFSIVANFVIPDEDERADIAKFYLTMWHKKGYYQEDLVRPQRFLDFAQATPNASPAEIEQMIEEAVDVRVQHVAELRRIKGYADKGRLNELLERERKFWLRFKGLVYDAEGKVITGWDDERVDWQALMETRSAISFGRANPEAVNENTRRKVAFHELGHFLALVFFVGNRVKPALLTAIPRRSNLGMVAHIPADTRDQHPQDYYEALIRLMIASWVTERFFFGQNGPGVTQDLINASNVAALEVGKWGMPGFYCPEKQRPYFANIGENLISEPATNFFNPQATALVESVLHNPTRRKEVAIILGMAVVDVYRILRVNQKIFLEVIPEFLRLDEFSGPKLTELWQKLEHELVRFDQMTKADRQALPKGGFAVKNPFYGGNRPEGAAIHRQIEAILEGGPS